MTEPALPALPALPDPPVRATRRGRQPRLALPEGLVLRAWTPDDAGPLLLAQRDPLVERYTGYLLADRAQALWSVQSFAATWARDEGAAWAVSDSGGTLLGSLRFGVTDRALGQASVGYWLAPELRGRGLATAALTVGSRTVFERLGLHRVELRHAIENERSCAVARRSGYRLEGTLRDVMRYPSDGRWSDEHLHARLAGDQQ